MKFFILVLILRLPGSADLWRWGAAIDSRVVNGSVEACAEWRDANEKLMRPGYWDARLYEIDVENDTVGEVNLECNDLHPEGRMEGTRQGGSE